MIANAFPCNRYLLILNKDTIEKIIDKRTIRGRANTNNKGGGPLGILQGKAINKIGIKETTDKMNPAIANLLFTRI